MALSTKSLGKFISLVLRHRPEAIGLRLDPGGWADLDEHVERSRMAVGSPVTLERVRNLVESQGKPRFSISSDGHRIRANYGHSVDLDLELEPIRPPSFLFHGTAQRTLERILSEGLEPRSRRYVHLSTDRDDAHEVGRRHGMARILRVRSERMHREGHRFYRAATRIWLTARVPPGYLDLVDG